MNYSGMEEMMKVQAVTDVRTGEKCQSGLRLLFAD